MDKNTLKLFKITVGICVVGTIVFIYLMLNTSTKQEGIDSVYLNSSTKDTITTELYLDDSALSARIETVFEQEKVDKITVTLLGSMQAEVQVFELSGNKNVYRVTYNDEGNIIRLKSIN